MTDIIINKSAAIRRCLQRIREEFNEDAEHFSTDFTRQDSVILNLLRACEAAIDSMAILSAYINWVFRKAAATALPYWQQTASLRRSWLKITENGPVA